MAPKHSGFAAISLIVLGLSACDAPASTVVADVDCVSSLLLLATADRSADVVPTLSYYYGRLDAAAPDGGWEGQVVTRMRASAGKMDAVRRRATVCDRAVVDRSRAHMTQIQGEIEAP